MKRGLVILLACFALFTIATEAFAPVYAVFVGNIGGNLLTAGGAYAVFGIVTGVLIFFLGRWEDRFKHLEKLVIVGFCIKAIGFGFYAMVSNPVQLILVQVVIAFGEAVSTPAYDGLYSKLLEKGKFASQWGFYDSLSYISFAVAGIIGGAIAHYLGFQMLFFFMILVSLAGVLVSLRLLVDKRRSKRAFFSH